MMVRIAWVMGIFWLGLAAAAGPARAQARADAVLSGDDLKQVSPHIWTITGYPNIAIIVGDTATLVVDTGMGPSNGATVAQAAARLSKGNGKLYLTTTHFHPEHASGDSGFPANTTLIRPAAQQQEMDASGDRMIDTFRKMSGAYNSLLEGVKLRKPDILFDSSYHLDLGGGVRVDLLWFGPAHTQGDELVRVQPDDALVTGDVVQNRTIPTFSCAECDPATWLQVLDQVAAIKPRLIVPDHSPPGGMELLAGERDFMESLRDGAAALRQKGTSADACKTALVGELEKKYANWSSLNRLAGSVEKACKSG